VTFDELKDKAHALPLKPGVYIMMDKTGKVIYVGKAKALKNRVSQYFQDSSAHTEKTRNMVSTSTNSDVILAHSEFEALCWNARSSAQQPTINILLKEDQVLPLYPSVLRALTQISLATRAGADEAQFFSPTFPGPQPDIIDARHAALKSPLRPEVPRTIGWSGPSSTTTLACRRQLRPDGPEPLVGCHSPSSPPA
jgi:excinuclease ABC subunit C